MPLASQANSNANRRQAELSASAANQQAAENKPLTAGQQLSGMLSGAANAIKKEVTEDIALANETIHHPLGRKLESKLGRGSAKKRASAAKAAPAASGARQQGWSSYSEPAADAYSAETVEGVGNLYKQ